MSSTEEKTEIYTLKSLIELIGSAGQVKTQEDIVIETLQREGLIECQICRVAYSDDALIYTHGSCTGHLHKVCLDGCLKHSKTCSFCKKPVFMDLYKHYTYKNFIKERAEGLGIAKELTEVQQEMPVLSRLSSVLLDRLLAQVRDMAKKWSFYSLSNYIDSSHFGYNDEIVVMKHEGCKGKIMKRRDYIAKLPIYQDNPYDQTCPDCHNSVTEFYKINDSNQRLYSTHDHIYQRYVLDYVRIIRENSIFENAIHNEKFLRKHLEKRVDIQKAILQDLIKTGIISLENQES